MTSRLRNTTDSHSAIFLKRIFYVYIYIARTAICFKTHVAAQREIQLRFRPISTKWNLECAQMLFDGINPLPSTARCMLRLELSAEEKVLRSLSALREMRIKNFFLRRDYDGNSVNRMLTRNSVLCGKRIPLRAVSLNSL